MVAVVERLLYGLRTELVARERESAVQMVTVGRPPVEVGTCREVEHLRAVEPQVEEVAAVGVAVYYVVVVLAVLLPRVAVCACEHGLYRQGA